MSALVLILLLGEPTFSTPLEARQWRAIVQLEDEVRGATTAHGLCEAKLARCRRAPIELPPLPPPTEAMPVSVESDTGPDVLAWASLMLAIAAVSFGLGVAVGAP